MPPFFSIVTPVLNGACYIEDYLASLLGQTFVNWEAIIIDDGSSDDSFEKLEHYTRHDQRFILEKLPPQLSGDGLPRGPYRPRNVGISLAQGDYVCFFDIDDYWLSGKLMYQYIALQRSPRARLLHCSFYKADSVFRFGYVKPFLDWIPVKLQVLVWNPIPNLTSCVQTSLARSNPFLAVHHEDYVFWYNVLKLVREDEIVRISIPLALYRTTANSTSGNKFRVLSWWLRCYDLFGYNMPLSLLFIIVKLSAELVEALLVRARILPVVRLSCVCQQTSV
jgi:teichuronic acid biosynthesis glycosyltransferase TuaG